MSCGHIVLADSHSYMLERIRRVTERIAESSIVIADEFSPIQAIHGTRPDLVIADFSFRVSWVETVARLIKQHQRSAKVIVARLYDDEAAF